MVTKLVCSYCGAHLLESYCKESSISDTNWLGYLFLSYLIIIRLSLWCQHLANLHKWEWLASSVILTSNFEILASHSHARLSDPVIKYQVSHQLQYAGQQGTGLLSGCSLSFHTTLFNKGCDQQNTVFFFYDFIIWIFRDQFPNEHIPHLHEVVELCLSLRLQMFIDVKAASQANKVSV